MLLIGGALSGCKGSSTSPPPPVDAGADKDATSDSASSCPNDDGMRNKVKGAACTCNAQCATGFCADGFCCDKECSGTCMSCGLATALGTCTFTPPGVKPRVSSQCDVQDVSTCGQDGTCDGAGKCRSYESGTVCVPGTCAGDALTNSNVCDGAGRCKLGPSTVCAPFSCNAATNLCFPTCMSDADCVAGRKCLAGSCGKKMNGALCPMGDSECASGHCADGVCCNTGCGGACRSCNLVGLQGTCSPVSAGKGHPLCALQDPTTCGTTGVCDGFGTCSLYPATTPCGASTCSGAGAMNTGRTCDGLGTCKASEVQQCGTYKCAAGACNAKCTTNADCADGIACVVATGSCGPKVDGQACTANADCQNQHCVDGVCCNTACAGACRSCALAGSIGKCTLAAAAAADPRMTCVDMTASTCGTNGKCDGTGGCQKYPAGTTVCAPETCTADVYTGPSTCNASGQCIKPNALACSPYHCNVTKCFTACTTSNECIPPNSCGMNGNISSCGPSPGGASCSANNQCASNFCAQGVCCNSACTNACQACNLAGTVGSCTNVASGADPQNKCTVQSQTSCGTTGQCAAGQCARWTSGTQCVAAGCPTASTRAPASTCNGTGTCVTPATMNCAPGRCASATCVNTCTVNTDCTAPATCVNGSCGLQPKGGSCTATSMCAAGLTCYLSEGSTGVCCDTACSGTCESCKLAGLVGTCSPIPAGMTDPDPATVCVADLTTMSCGLNGRCAGNNTTTNGAGTTRCQFYGSTQGCRLRSCTPGDATHSAVETSAASCAGTGTCPATVVTSCGLYNKCTGTNTQCATSCSSDADCVGVTCNTKTGRCGDKLGPGAACGVGTDCTSGFCADGVCCNSACGGACQACNLTGSVGMCTGVSGVPPGAPHPGCTATSPCGLTGLCSSGACATSTAQCQAASCVGSSLTPPRMCSGVAAACPAGVSAACPGALVCQDASSCKASCATAADCAGTGVACFLPAGTCGSKLGNGSGCSTGTDCTSGNCVDGVCCDSGCAGACQACNLSTGGNTVGVCGPVPAGTADAASCPTTANGCATNTGLCASGGTCAKVGSGTSCGSASCVSPGAGMTVLGSCDGLGSCNLGATTTCNNYACVGNLCGSMCTDDTQCVSNVKCNTVNMSCSGRPAGQMCSVNADCGSGLFCVDAVCCHSASCPAATCDMTSSMLTPASTCGSDGNCSMPTPVACPTICADTMSCVP